MSFAEFESFVKHLPPESAYQTVIRDRYTDEQLAAMTAKGHGAWSKHDFIMADLIDAIFMLIHTELSIAAGEWKGSPEQYARPGMVSKNPSLSAQSDVYHERLQRALEWRAQNHHE